MQIAGPQVNQADSKVATDMLDLCITVCGRGIQPGAGIDLEPGIETRCSESYSVGSGQRDDFGLDVNGGLLVLTKNLVAGRQGGVATDNRQQATQRPCRVSCLVEIDVVSRQHSRIAAGHGQRPTEIDVVSRRQDSTVANRAGPVPFNFTARATGRHGQTGAGVEAAECIEFDRSVTVDHDTASGTDRLKPQPIDLGSDRQVGTREGTLVPDRVCRVEIGRVVQRDVSSAGNSDRGVARHGETAARGVGDGATGIQGQRRGNHRIPEIDVIDIDDLHRRGIHLDRVEIVGRRIERDILARRIQVGQPRDQNRAAVSQCTARNGDVEVAADGGIAEVQGVDVLQCDVVATDDRHRTAKVVARIVQRDVVGRTGCQ